MKMLDEVTTSEGTGMVVGLPDYDTVEVRLHDEGRTLRMFRRDDVQTLAKNGDVLTAEIPAPVLVEITEADLPKDDGVVDLKEVPLGRSGRPLAGAALAKHRAKQGG